MSEKKLSINPVEIEENVLSMMLYLQKREKENASKNRDKMLRTDDKTLTNINICVIFFFSLQKTVLDSYLLWFHRVFFFSMIRIAVDFSFFSYKYVDCALVFLSTIFQFSQFVTTQICSYFLHIHKLPKKQKKSQVAFLFPNDFDARDFFAIECFSTQCDVNQGELEE